MTDYDQDPAALAWARAKAQAYIDQLANWEKQADERGAEGKARGIAVSRLLAQRQFIGGGCTIGAFDERLPKYRALTDTAQGPSVAEAAADDRRWWDGEKTGET